MEIQFSTFIYEYCELFTYLFGAYILKEFSYFVDKGSPH